MPRVVIPQLEEVRNVNVHTYESIKALLRAVNNLGDLLNVDPRGARVSGEGSSGEPAPPLALSVTGENGVYDIRFTPNPANQGVVLYFLEAADDATFQGEIDRFFIGSQPRTKLPFPGATKHFRGYIAYLTGEESTRVLNPDNPVSSGALDFVDMPNIRKFTYKVPQLTGASFHILGETDTTASTGTGVTSATEGPDNNDPICVRIRSGTSLNSYMAKASGVAHRSGRNLRQQSYFRLNETTNIFNLRLWACVLTDVAFTTMPLNDSPAGNYIGFRFSSSGSTAGNWKAVINGVAIDTGIDVLAARTFEVQMRDDLTPRQAIFKINGQVVVIAKDSLLTPFPALGANLNQFASISNKIANRPTAADARIGYILIQDNCRKL
jgi:hypothetical protein